MIDDFSAREVSMLLGLAEGLTNGEIGDELNFTEGTINQCLNRLYIKMGARNRAHAVALAYHNGILIPRVTNGRMS